MSQAEHPDRLSPDHEVTVEDVRQLMGASTPHFALQLRTRIHSLIRGLPSEHPARIEGEREIARLDRLAFVGEVRGHPAEPGLPPLPSVTDPGTGDRAFASESPDPALGRQAPDARLARENATDRADTSPNHP